MSNLSYCRFENTLQDLEDCYEFLRSANSEDFEEMSAREFNSMVRLRDLCEEIADEFETFPTYVLED